jgi:hypothetical protein
MLRGYIFDTCVFNRLADGKIGLTEISANGKFYATHVQLDELRATKQHVRREELVAVFKEVGPNLLPTETFVWGVSGFGSKWSDGQLFNNLKACLDAKEKKANNAQDAVIAEVAIRQSLILVTADRYLAEAARQHGANVQLIP